MKTKGPEPIIPVVSETDKDHIWMIAYFRDKLLEKSRIPSSRLGK